MPFSYAQLLDELQTDPKARGYAMLDAEQCAAALNEIGGTGETCPNTAVPIGAIMLAIDPDEWAALTVQQCLFLTAVATLPALNLNDAMLQVRLGAYFHAGSRTQAAFQSLLHRPASRAEALWGAGTTITANDVLNAYASADPPQV